MRQAGRWTDRPGPQTLSCPLTCHSVKIQTAWRRQWMEGWRDSSQRKGKERKPRPGPDNGELSGLRRGVGDISQIRTDHKPLDAIQFCGATIRRLIMCHPSIRPPPAALSLAINPLMTNSTLLQSPLSTFSLSACLYSLLSALSSLWFAAEAKWKRGLSKSGSDCKDLVPSNRDLIDRSFLWESIFLIGWSGMLGCVDNDLFKAT